MVQATEDLGLVDGVQNTQNIQPVGDLEILWAITKGVATLSNPASMTDSSGLASVTVTPGPLLGDIEVTATVSGEAGDSVEFSLRTTVFLVEILIDRFEVPLGGDSIEVVLGDTIEWVNRDALKHAVLSTSVPDGGFTFNSGDMDNSQRFRFVPKVEGLFEYVDPLSVQDVNPTGLISVVGQDVGALRVVTTTSGENPDPAYVVTINGVQSSAIGPADEVTFPALRATAQAVRLVEVQPNCTVAGDNPRTVTVVAQDTVARARPAARMQPRRPLAIGFLREYGCRPTAVLKPTAPGRCSPSARWRALTRSIPCASGSRRTGQRIRSYRGLRLGRFGFGFGRGRLRTTILRCFRSWSQWPGTCT